MARLEISLFGGFQVRLEGSAVTQFESDKVRALLAYLAVECDRPHRREGLAALLWPSWPEAAARANLRRALCDLRQRTGDRETSRPFVAVSRDQLSTNEGGDVFCDVVAFTRLARRQQANDPGASSESRRGAEARRAATLYRGRFLEGFFLRDSPAFDTWCRQVAERTRRQAAALLGYLACVAAGSGRLALALDYAGRRVDLEPWNEEAHRHLMHLLAGDGQRAAALHQYRLCRDALQAELGVAPGAETEHLYRQIRDATLV